jgi:RNA polymerase sigma factor (sigma-70 family)
VVDRPTANRPFEDIVTEHGSVVMRVCCALVGPSDADDAWSETFLAALRSYPELRPDSNIRGWLVTIAHNKSVDAIRTRSRSPRPTADVPETHVHDDADGLDDDVRDDLTALPPKQRRAVIYRHLAGLSYAEIGELLDSNEAAARRSVADGLAKLRLSHERRHG